MILIIFSRKSKHTNLKNWSRSLFTLLRWFFFFLVSPKAPGNPIWRIIACSSKNKKCRKIVKSEKRVTCFIDWRQRTIGRTWSSLIFLIYIPVAGNPFLKQFYCIISRHHNRKVSSVHTLIIQVNISENTTLKKIQLKIPTHWI